MNKNDFKNPLIQSGAVLLFVFLLISIVAASESQGVWGSIGALFSGLVSGIVFLISLCFAIIFSIFIIVVLFIAAVSIYSVDKGKEVWTGFVNGIGALFQNVTGSSKTISRLSATAADVSASASVQTVQPVGKENTERLTSLDAKLNSLTLKLSALTQESADQAAAIEQLKEQVADLAATESIDAKFTDITVSQQAFEKSLEEITGKLASNSERQQQFETQCADELGSIREALEDLQEKTSVPETVSGILSYIDLPEDRDYVTEKAKEAISRGMTYAQIDEFFKASLKPEVYGELASHPRLTKDFLRSVKKKF